MSPSYRMCGVIESDKRVKTPSMTPENWCSNTVPMEMMTHFGEDLIFFLPAVPVEEVMILLTEDQFYSQFAKNLGSNNSQKDLFPTGDPAQTTKTQISCDYEGQSRLNPPLSGRVHSSTRTQISSFAIEKDHVLLMLT